MRRAYLLPLVLILTAPAFADDIGQLQQRVAELEAQLAAAEARIAHLERELAQARGEKQQLTALAGITPEGELVDQAKARIVTESDGAILSERMALPVLRGSRADHYLSAGAAPGSDDITLFIQTRYSGGVYRDVQTLRADLEDGSAIDIPVVNYQAVPRRIRTGNTTRTLDDETITLKLPRADASRLAAAPARRVPLQLAGVTLELEREHLATLRAVVMRTQP